MTKPRWLSPEEQSAWRNWIAVSRLLPEQLSKDLEEEHGLSLVEYEILAILSEAPDQKLRMHELARATWASRSKLTHQVNRLESLGFVNRETCKIDARGQFAVLTKKGVAKVTKAAPDHVQSVRAHLVDQLGKRFVGFGNLNATIVKHLTKIAPDDSCGTKS